VSKRGTDFLEAWVSENINPEGYAPEGDDSRAKELAEQCLFAAKAQGITKDELEEDVGDIVDYMADAAEDATDAEVARLAAKDD